jgi:shikimate 5-dehydrogenase
VAILGTGGAARAVAVALESEGSLVTVYGRSQSKADAVARIVAGAGAMLPVTPGSWDLLVNTTPVGMFPNIEDTPFAGPFDGKVVYDLVYNPTETRLLKAAAAAGCDVIGGLDMLVAQAEDQSEWWLGRRPPANVLREAAIAAL